MKDPELPDDVLSEIFRHTDQRGAERRLAPKWRGRGGWCTEEFLEEMKTTPPTAWEIKRLYASTKKTRPLFIVVGNYVMYILDPVTITRTAVHPYRVVNDAIDVYVGRRGIDYFHSKVNFIFDERISERYDLYLRREIPCQDYLVDSFTTRAIVTNKLAGCKHRPFSLLDFLPEDDGSNRFNLYVVGIGVLLGLIDVRVTVPTREEVDRILDVLRTHSDFQ